MKLCPFLTTKRDKVFCFKECCFFKEDGDCIFMQLETKKDYDEEDDILYVDSEEENKFGDFLEEYIHI